MVANFAFPLVRAMLAEVYNNSFMCTHSQHVDLTAEQVTFEWVGTTTQYACTEQDLAAAEQLLTTNPQLVKLFPTEQPDSALPQPLVYAANAYCESLGII